MEHQLPTLDELVRETRFRGRLDLIVLLESQAKSAARLDAARALVRELAMQRVFDRFTAAQETVLLERLASLAQLGSTALPPIFGEVARSTQR